METRHIPPPNPLHNHVNPGENDQDPDKIKSKIWVIIGLWCVGKLSKSIIIRARLCRTTWARASSSATRAWWCSESPAPTPAATPATSSTQRGRASPTTSPSPSNVGIFIWSPHICIVCTSLHCVSTHEKSVAKLCLLVDQDLPSDGYFGRLVWSVFN